MRQKGVWGTVLGDDFVVNVPNDLHPAFDGTDDGSAQETR
jgi:hypothetical protein